MSVYCSCLLVLWSQLVTNVLGCQVRQLAKFPALVREYQVTHDPLDPFRVIYLPTTYAALTLAVPPLHHHTSTRLLAWDFQLPLTFLVGRLTESIRNYHITMADHSSTEAATTLPNLSPTAVVDPGFQTHSVSLFEVPCWKNCCSVMHLFDNLKVTNRQLQWHIDKFIIIWLVTTSFCVNFK